MSVDSQEPRSWPDEAQADAMLDELRNQLEAMKARMEEHRAQMQAAGLARTRADDCEPIA